jgi:nucleoside-diphosphate-sugar epimerase
MTAPRIFVFGMGYTARAFAAMSGSRAEWIRGTTRDGSRGTRVFDGTTIEPAIADDLASATHLIVSVPSGEDDPVLATFASAIAAAPDLKWIGYLSSVAVYGNYGGAWVTERTTPHPKTERSVRRLAAERDWIKLAAARAVPLATFRLAGIYGPARNAFVNLAEGRAHRIVKPGQVFNRIHVDDIAGALVAAVERGAAGTFNIADDRPSPPQDVVTDAAEIMGISPPPEVPYAAAELSPMARSFYADNKRIKNTKAKQELGWVLRYPDYRRGLSALWQSGAWRRP